MNGQLQSSAQVGVSVMPPESLRHTFATVQTVPPHGAATMRFDAPALIAL